MIIFTDALTALRYLRKHHIHIAQACTQGNSLARSILAAVEAHSNCQNKENAMQIIKLADQWQRQTR